MLSLLVAAYFFGSFVRTGEPLGLRLIYELNFEEIDIISCGAGYEERSSSKETRAFI
jgi:hypothetical protein